MGDLLGDSVLPDLLTQALGSDPRPVAVAVSGGSDSTALLVLARDWALATGASLQAVTVDHGLRPEAAQEAEAVARLCASLGVPHGVLRWDDAPGGNVMAEARRARYRLLADWAKRQGVAEVLIAHTRDDQAETFLMRLTREAGLDGLAAMREVWAEENGVTFRRPLLAATRADLRCELTARGIGWIDDPTNADDRYERVRARKVLAALEPLGITVGQIANVGGHLASVRHGLDEMLAGWADEHSRMDRGDLILSADALAALPPEPARRVLVAALRLVSASPYPPRAEKLAPLLAADWTGRRTLHGCLIAAEAGSLRIAREPSAAAKAPDAGPGELWDGRWFVTGDGPGTIRPLGERGLRGLEDWRETGLPRASLLASPAVWEGDRLIAAPLAGKSCGWQAELAERRNRLSQFIRLH